MNELSLIPTADLLNELDKRYPEGFIAAWCSTEHERDVDNVDHCVHLGNGSNGAIISLCTYALWNAQKDYYTRNRDVVFLDDDDNE